MNNTNDEAKGGSAFLSWGLEQLRSWHRVLTPKVEARAESNPPPEASGGGAELQGGASLVLVPTVECIVLLLMCLYLLWGYADKKRTSVCIRLVALVGWFLSFALVVFLPLDIYMA